MKRLKTALALDSVRSGASSHWINPDTGYRYVVTGTACRQGDGSWRTQP